MSALRGGLMVCGTSSDSGKTTLVTALCRLLARRGVRVAPFKAQNMALNSAVTADGAEIGRAQAAQAEAAGVEAEAAMNPVLLKPSSDRTSQIIVMGRPWATLDAAAYQEAKHALWGTVTEQLDGLRRRFDVVICEGAGSPAEINLMDNDLVNLRLAHHAGIPALIVGDIDRGGVFASMFGTVALLPDAWRPLVGGFVINKFRGDPAVLSPAPDELERRTGVPTLGVLPWIDGLGIDAEDSLALRQFEHRSGAGDGSVAAPGLDVAVVAFPKISNFTDLDALRLEPGVTLRMVRNVDSLGRPDLIILPGTKATVDDLAWLRSTGLAGAIEAQAADPVGPSVLGICGGYQMMGERIDDAVESCRPVAVEGLSLLRGSTRFEVGKVTRVRQGTALGHPVRGYEIHHGRTEAVAPWVNLESPGGAQREGSSAGAGRVLGTSLHGLLESDPFRRAYLAAVAGRAGKRFVPGPVGFEAARQARFDRLADAVEDHLDIAAIERLIASASTDRKSRP